MLQTQTRCTCSTAPRCSAMAPCCRGTARREARRRSPPARAAQSSTTCPRLPDGGLPRLRAAMRAARLIPSSSTATCTLLRPGCSMRTCPSSARLGLMAHRPSPPPSRNRRARAPALRASTAPAVAHCPSSAPHRSSAPMQRVLRAKGAFSGRRPARRTSAQQARPSRSLPTQARPSQSRP